ncbi:MAG: heparan-alpha-glucosaminide N-acetyltransferase domain-containing protein [Terriglobales bacterium]
MKLMTASAKPRLAYIDWMRGLACVLMFQTHCYDSWLGGPARKSTFFMWSQLGGTLPAPLFLFLAGISFALVTDKLRQRGADPNQIARTTILRGAEIFGLGLLFRVQEYLLGLPWAPWTDLLRVDILNTIGFSMMLMGVMCRLAGGGRRRSAVVAAGVALAIALATPLVWTTLRLRVLPWPLESYINGVHTFKQPQAWLFPVFPWTGFAFAGLATGFLLVSDWVRRREVQAFALLGGAGVGITAIARWLDHRPRQIYGVYDFWHTSPNFFLIRVGLLLMILLGVYLWCRWTLNPPLATPAKGGAPTAIWGFSPMIQLGQTSLLVYWVHIEFVYGRFSILSKRAMGIGGASLGLAVIFVAMVLLSLARTKLKGRGTELAAWMFRRRPAQKRAAIAP